MRLKTHTAWLAVVRREQDSNLARAEPAKPAFDLLLSKSSRHATIFGSSRSEDGFSLIELLVVSVVFLAFLIALLNHLGDTSRWNKMLTNHMEALDKTQAALDFMVEEIRQAGNGAIDVEPAIPDLDVDNADVFSILDNNKIQLQVGDVDGDFVAERATYQVSNNKLIRTLEQRSGNSWVPDNAIPSAVLVDRVTELRFSYLKSDASVVNTGTVAQKAAQLAKVELRLRTYFGNRLTPPANGQTITLNTAAGIRMAMYRREI